MLRVRTAGKLGYCFGVSQAIDKAIKFAEEHGKVYSWGTLAHNENVVALLRRHAVEPIKTDGFDSVSQVAITAHGAPPELYRMFEDAGLHILDCTCPIVRRAQKVVREQLDGFDIVIFGDPDHQEVKGLNGWANGAKFVGNFNDLFTPSRGFKMFNLSKKVGIISQTTKTEAMFADFVTTLISHNIGRFSEMRVFNTICPIVSSRVKETIKLSWEVDMMLVVGSQESANTKNLADVAIPGVGQGCVYIVQGVDQVEEALNDWLVENEMTSPKVGVTAGTSTPIEVVKEVVIKIKELLYERESGD